VVALALAPASMAQTNVISTVAGTGARGFSGDHGAATAARIDHPAGIAATSDGGFVFADEGNSVIRYVSPTGVITTIAGNGTQGYSGDGGPATQAQLNPAFVAVAPDGGLLITDTGNHVIRRVSPQGIITTVAGTGTPGAGGDGAATSAQLHSPYAARTTPDGGFLIADEANNRVRDVSAAGRIATVAGTGTYGFGGDGGPATQALFGAVESVAPTGDGGFLVADTSNFRVRRVSAGGTATTVAGDGGQAFAGDGGPATAARFMSLDDVLWLPDGGFLTSDAASDRVRRISAAGVIGTIAGNGTSSGPLGDGGLATAARVDGPAGVAVNAHGGLLISEFRRDRIRLVDAGLPVPPLPPPPAVPAAPPSMTAPTPPHNAHNRQLGSCLGTQMALLEAYLAGSRVIVRGAVDENLADEPIAVRQLGTGRRRTLSRVTARADGSFTASLPAPPQRLLSSARYQATLSGNQAVVGGIRSQPIGIDLRVHTTVARVEGTRVRIQGQVVPPLTSPPTLVRIREYNGCRPADIVASARVRRNGAFNVLFAPDGDDATAIYRAETRVAPSARTRTGRGVRAVTRPVPVQLP
jgi:hypothetical protein